MNHEKKLEYFAEAIAKEVESRKLKARKQMAEDMDQAITIAVAEADTKAEQYILNETQAMQKTGNKRISEAQAQARYALASLREDLNTRLLEDVKADIDTLTKSDGYKSYIINSIQTAVANSKHSFIYIQLTPGDMRLGPAVREATGLTPEEGDDSDLGGFKLLTANRGIEADFTFKSRLLSASEDFHAMQYD